MNELLLDTHVWAWTLDRPDELPLAVLHAINEARGINVCAASFYEIAYKSRLGK